MKKGRRESRTGRALNFVVLAVLLVLVSCEIYYVFMLREKIEDRSYELKSMSMQLRSLKNERLQLHEELASIKYAAREDVDGNSPVR